MRGGSQGPLLGRFAALPFDWLPVDHDLRCLFLRIDRACRQGRLLGTSSNSRGAAGCLVELLFLLLIFIITTLILLD